MVFLSSTKGELLQLWVKRVLQGYLKKDACIHLQKKKTLGKQSKRKTFEQRLLFVILYNISYANLHLLKAQKTYNHAV